jgi:hypothetical protein
LGSNKVRMSILISVTALLILVTLLSVVAHANDLAGYLRASQEFQELVAHAAKEGRVPRLMDRNAADLILVLSDSKRYLDETTYEVKDLRLLADVCGKANAAVMLYALFDLGNAIDRKADATRIALQVAQLMERNVERFQDELQHLQPFLLRCLAKQIPLLNDFIVSLPPAEFTDVRRAGVQNTRQGAFAVYYGFLQAANNRGLKEPYKEAVFSAMAENAAQYASILQPTTRRQVADVAASMSAVVHGRLRDYIEQILRAMKDTRCEGLCRF